MTTWSDVGSTYAEAVQGLFPLHRACIFLFGLVSSLAVEKNSLTPVVQTMAEIKLSELTSISAGFFKEASVLNVFFGCLTVMLSLVLSKVLTRCLYFLINRSTNFISKAINLDRSWVNGLSIEDRKNWIDLIEQGISEAKIRIQRFSAFGELAAGVFLVLITSSAYTGVMDLWIALAFLLIGVLLHGIKMYIFFKDFFGSALTKEQLQGRVMPKPSL